MYKHTFTPVLHHLPFQWHSANFIELGGAAAAVLEAKCFAVLACYKISAAQQRWASFALFSFIISKCFHLLTSVD